MIRKLLVLIIAACLQTGLVNSQENLSNKYDDFSTIEVRENLIFYDYVILNTDFKDFDIPDCSRMYPGISSYFGFVIPESGKITLSANIHDTGLFGLAIYLEENGELTEITCNVFRDGAGHLTIRENFELYANKNAVGRIWLIDKNHEGVIELAVTERPSNIQAAHSKSSYMSHNSEAENTNLNQDIQIEQLRRSFNQFQYLKESDNFCISKVYDEINEIVQNQAPNFPGRTEIMSDILSDVKEWLYLYSDEYYLLIEALDKKYHEYKTIHKTE